MSLGAAESVIVLTRAEARIEQDRADIREEIGGDVDGRRDQHRRLYQGQVAQLKVIAVAPSRSKSVTPMR